MKVRYLGNDNELLKKYYSYDIDFTANPRGVWVKVKGMEKFYDTLTDFALAWKVIDKRRIFDGEVEHIDEYINGLERDLDREKARRIMLLEFENFD